MKKTKLLALTLVVAIMLVGAGYAAWTDTLVVKTQVNTGYLDVDFVKVEKPKPFPFIGYNDPQDMTINTPDPTALGGEGENGADKDLIVFELINMYPGAEGRRYVTFKNTGTLEAKINLNELEFVETNVPTALKGYIEIEAEKDTSGAPFYPYSEGTELEEVQEADMTTLSHSNSNTLYLKPGDEGRIIVYFKMLDTAPNNTEVINNAVYTMTLNVKQFNQL